jgi:predicted AAA+ superfamily ATPase
MSYIPRTLEPAVAGFIRSRERHKNVLLVEGARQVGKTCLVDHAIAASGKKTCTANLERDPRLRSLIDGCRDFAEFEQVLADRLKFSPGPDSLLFIDESQESRQLGRFIRFMKEDWRDATVILSGSTLSRLFRDDVRYPVGRVQQLVVSPFSFSEYLVAVGENPLAAFVRGDELPVTPARHERLLELFDGFLGTGGLPAAVLAHAAGHDHREVLAQIAADYERDFIRIFGERDADIVTACFRSVANFVGSPSKNTTVIPAPGTTINARINEVFARLQAWHLVLRSDQKGPSPDSSHAYLPKRYLFDTGLLRHFRELGMPSINVLRTRSAAARGPLGGGLENQVAVELARGGAPLCGWKKTPSGGEIDFLVTRKRKTVPVECKASLTLDGRSFRGIADYLHEYDQPLGVIVSFAAYGITEIVAPGSRRKRRIVMLPAPLLERLGAIIDA